MCYHMSDVVGTFHSDRSVLLPALREHSHDSCVPKSRGLWEVTPGLSVHTGRRFWPGRKKGL
jgi:hypothetical protein